MEPIQFDKIIEEAQVRFSRSGGKGGQNVNKIESKVELIFNILNSHHLTQEQKDTLYNILGKKIDHEGAIHITASKERHQAANRKEAQDKLVALITKSLTPIKPRKKSSPTASSKEKRLTAKRLLGQKKKERRYAEE